MKLQEQLIRLKSIKLSDVRKVISKECYSRSLFKAIIWFCIDLIVFLTGMMFIFNSARLGLHILGSVICGVAAAMMFVWAHDAAHGTLFKSSKVAEIMGTLFMLPSLNVYRLWIYGHNKVHHGFTSFSPFDWIWRPLTPEQYFALSKVGKLFYRLERNLLTCALHYLRKVWWLAMIVYNPAQNPKQKWGHRLAKLLVLTYFIAMAALGYFYAGGIAGIFFAVIIPFIIFSYFIALIVYLHHTHPDIPFFDIKQDWSHSIGLLYCSTIIHCSRLSEMLLHNIMIHVPHHVDIRIPFYHLKRAFRDLKRHYGEYIHEYRFRWFRIVNIFRRCKLYDFENKSWMTYKQARLRFKIT